MPPVDSVHVQLSAVFADDLHVEVPSPDTDLLTSGRLDSVGMVELLIQLEKRFQLRVEMEDLEPDHFRSLATIAAFIVARQPAMQDGVR
jgi:acyl carrier protein